jgi:hypothetical protein
MSDYDEQDLAYQALLEELEEVRRKLRELEGEEE